MRYEPAAVVRHDHRTTLRPWLRRKAFYGTGAAPLADRHGADVAPLVLTPWTAALTGGACWRSAAGRCRSRRGRRRGVTARGRRGGCAEPTHPVRTAASLTALGAVVGRCSRPASALTRHYWPVAALAAPRSPARPPRAAGGRRVADGLLDHRRVRPDLDPVRFIVARRLDDLAYGAGVWAGARRARSPRACVPAFRGFPIRRGTS